MIFSDTEPGVCKWTNCNRSGWRVDRAAGHHMVCVLAAWQKFNFLTSLYRGFYEGH